MGLFSAFSKQRQPRGFNLQHRYYDEKKAKMESRRQAREGERSKDSDVRREQLRDAWASKRSTNAKGGSARGPLMLILILGALGYIVLRYLTIPHVL
ncbi:hypothetical protein OAV84_01335 [Schleiferiaceae bacterium]|jgi:hypothetical protein|nr:hypothetical protein [Schleiferiaceae bacterium]MDA9151755.1 hypothetical protein [Schleiferiaceae bacterium]MDC3353721.1 hypothetical protein [Schleiferiaceae bacterium]